MSSQMPSITASVLSMKVAFSSCSTSLRSRKPLLSSSKMRNPNFALSTKEASVKMENPTITSFSSMSWLPALSKWMKSRFSCWFSNPVSNARQNSWKLRSPQPSVSTSRKFSYNRFISAGFSPPRGFAISSTRSMSCGTRSTGSTSSPLSSVTFVFTFALLASSAIRCAITLPMSKFLKREEGFSNRLRNSSKVRFPPASASQSRIMFAISCSVTGSPASCSASRSVSALISPTLNTSMASNATCSSSRVYARLWIPGIKKLFSRAPCAKLEPFTTARCRSIVVYWSRVYG
mmetsp:Transcript_19704/g.49459  ORF Transcript_19704/g.49459 Transcript_19704/m.49459 type:complete len:291 (-) Transcript_19704:146-1018(-)